MGRHEPTNEQWRRIRDLFPRPATRRGKPRHPRRLLDGVFWIFRTGAPWRGLPERCGPGKTVWRRFDPWRREGRLDRAKQRLLAHRNEAGELGWDLWCADGTSIRAARCASGGRKGGA
ncbi:MAG: transposase [Planctomycetota bacterium]|nr:MAG: transposase [Planctomycetota bacterium]